MQELTQARSRSSTFFGLMAEFGTTQIPLALCCQAYFGCDEHHAKEKAAASRLPVPAFKIGSQKSQWFIHAADLAEHIDRQREAQTDRWVLHQGGRS